jgi:hypothetical protein
METRPEVSKAREASQTKNRKLVLNEYEGSDLALSDDFIRPRQHLLRYRQADLLGCFQIDNPTVFSLPIRALSFYL